MVVYAKVITPDDTAHIFPLSALNQKLRPLEADTRSLINPSTVASPTEALTEALTEDEGEPDAEAEGDAEELGLKLELAEGDREALGDVDVLALGLLDGLGEVEEEGETVVDNLASF